MLRACLRGPSRYDRSSLKPPTAANELPRETGCEEESLLPGCAALTAVPQLLVPAAQLQNRLGPRIHENPGWGEPRSEREISGPDSAPAPPERSPADEAATHLRTRPCD